MPISFLLIYFETYKLYVSSFFSKIKKCVEFNSVNAISFSENVSDSSFLKNMWGHGVPLW